MKLFLCLALVAVAVASPAAPLVSNSNSNVQEANEGEVQFVQPLQAFDLTRLRKSAYGGASSSSGYSGGASVQAPPCPKNYVFSCQPSLSPVACSSASSSSYGSHGAYSAPVPSYVAPLPSNGYVLPQSFAYSNQYYQY